MAIDAISQASVVALLLFVAAGAPPAGYHPVVVAGPLLGQNFEVKNDDSSSYCYTDGKWKWLWGNPGLQKLETLCILEDLALAGWDNVENLTVHQPKVQVRPYLGDGHTRSGGLPSLSPFSGLDILDGNVTTRMASRLHKNGYVNDESFFGHAYDWRLGVRDWQVNSFPALRSIVESATRISGGSKAILTGISMAGPYLHAFLSWTKTRDPTWAGKHIHAFVPVAAPFNGAVMALSAVVSSILQTWSTDGLCPHCNPPKTSPVMPPSGKSIIDQWEAWFKGQATALLDDTLKKLVWQFPSVYWMSTGLDHSTDPPTDPLVITMVNGEVPEACSEDKTTATTCGALATRDGWQFDNPEFLSPTQCGECYKLAKLFSCAAGYEQAFAGWVENLCCKRHQCRAESYRASETPKLLRKIGRPQSADMMEYALSVGTTADPGVPVHCIFSHNVQTFSNLSFETHESLGNVTVYLDDGDQTVDAKSAEVCTRWPSTVKVYRVPGVKHASALDVMQVVDVIEAIAINNDDGWKNWKEPAFEDVVTGYNNTVVDTEDLLIAPPQWSLPKLFI